MLILKYLPLAASLVTALPYATPKKKSLSLSFDRVAIRSSDEWQRRRLTKRQGNDSSTAEDDDTPLLNNNNISFANEVAETWCLFGEKVSGFSDTRGSIHGYDFRYSAFVYSVQPADLENEPADSLPPLFDNATAQGVTYLDLLYNASYGAGNEITTTLGAIGLTPLALNGTEISADNLTFANVYDADSGLGGQGLIGLSFPLNSAIFGAVTAARNESGTPLTATEAQQYYPLVPLLQLEGKIDQSIFGLVVDRIPADIVAPADANVYNYTYGSGALTLGDFPEGYTESDFTWSPVPVVQISESFTAAGYPTAAGFQWTTPLDAIYFNGKKIRNTTEPPHADSEGGNYYALVDSGNPAMQIPEDMMREITDAWAANPDNRVMPCDSDFELILQIGGTNFTMAKADVLVPSYQANDGVGAGGSATKDCQFQAQPDAPTGDVFGPNTGQTYALGDVFLRNVAAVFDYGNLLDATQQAPRMGFAQR